MRAASSLVCVLALAGCAAAPPATMEFESSTVARTEFSLDVRILRGADIATAATEPAAVASRYIVFPDGSLHFGSGPARSVASRPGLTRRLTHEQLAELWAIARRTGLADPANGDFAGNIGLETAPAESIVQFVSFTVGNEHWAFRREAPAGAEADPALGELIRLLARLAWAPDVSEEPLRTAPPRYNFGPDPYARFRRP